MKTETSHIQEEKSCCGLKEAILENILWGKTSNLWFVWSKRCLNEVIHLFYGGRNKEIYFCSGKMAKTFQFWAGLLPYDFLGMESCSTFFYFLKFFQIFFKVYGQKIVSSYLHI